ncbi:hypothetical protein N7495_002632 [Penicillium taxi]|uniref:uncharacterized protein n=1 Tax=Penicillium taxi TaxID=168475 RepID=UPI00254537F3|nr:uncharacterized protein N7495_002632 [Penicillium taxi]KAJ5902104.1 hypothetical protein N7495_002632 [Penicillium taxi]
MKLLTKEEEDAHYNVVVKGGAIGGLAGLAAGAAGVALAGRRFSTVRHLTLPMKSFLVTSSGTFFGITAGDHASRNWDTQFNSTKQWYENREERLRNEENQNLSLSERAFAFARRERYKIVGLTWVASMVGSFAIVGRSPYLTGAQKIVQARVYAQGLTLAVLVASAAFEISDQRRVRAEKKALQNDLDDVPHHSASKDDPDMWRDMVDAEEQRLKAKHLSLSVQDSHHSPPQKNKKKAKTESKHDSEPEAEKSEAEKTETESESEKKE